MVSRDFRSKYLNSAFGSFWAILNPLAMILVYTLIFSQVMGTRLPNSSTTLAYSVYLCAGLLPWQLFSETIMRMQNIFVEQGQILKKVSFPRSSLLVYVLCSTFVNFSIIFSIYLIFLLVTGLLPGAPIIAMIPLLLIQQLFAVGIGLIAGTLNVFFRDIGHIIGVILQFWSWLTPIVYAIDIVPDHFKPFYSWNVVVPIIEGYQSIFLRQEWPDWMGMWPVTLIALVLLIFGYGIFKKLDKEMVDEL